MGCDIHPFVEVRENNEWKFTHIPSVDRWYQLFCTVARGVRGDNPNGFEVKGLPNDLSRYVAHEWIEWQNDGHSPSWLTLEEIQTKAATEMITDDSHDTSSTLQHFISECVFPKNVAPEDCRVIFWFDN